ncbi:hypothetical protein [Sphingomonas asaccharolytica]|uniref:hypothetical protein n=1 Tax=Sphingomonas asaccharolytica TaxID=40681 RepID=UPI00082F2C8D|nr:hypothetical protein [Sphingomonas asaccharolytica]
MQSKQKWLFAVVWIGLHFTLAVGALFAFVDQFELINQVTMPSVCDAVIKAGGWGLKSRLVFAFTCLDPDNLRDFFVAALIGVALFLSPLTLAAYRTFAKSDSLRR